MRSFTYRRFCIDTAILVLSSIGTVTPVQASPADYVFIPYADAGVRYIDYALGTEKPRGTGSEQAHYLALGWNPTSRWFTQVYAEWYKEANEGLGYSASSWINHFQIINAGEYPLDVGLYLKLEHPRDHEGGYEMTWGPTIQWEVANLQANLNLFFSKSIHVDVASPTSLSYQWQIKGLWQKGIELGAQGFGTVGSWQHWPGMNQQEHNIGPAIFGHWSMGKETAIKLDAAFLFGTTSNSPRHTFRLHAQYQF